MLFENMSRPPRKDFNHRPLKKRPVQVAEEEKTIIVSPPISPASYDDNSEPENLSTKPEDLLRTGNYPSNATSPPAGDAPVPLVTPRRWPEPAHHHPHHHHYQPQQQQQQPMPSPPPYHQYTPAPLASPQYHHHQQQQQQQHHHRLVAPVPLTYLPPHLSPVLAPYNPALEQPWARSPPMYAPCLPYGSLSEKSDCTTASSGSTIRDKEAPSSPVSVDSGISTESSGATAPRRRKDAASSAAPRYQCADCGKSYSTYSGLTKHRQFHCAAAEGALAAKRSFACKYCAKVYTSLGALKMHIRTHTLPCKCHLCGKAFSRPWLLQGHIRTHTGEKPFSCHHCRRAFADRSNLRAHLQTHSDVKKYSCAQCGKTFSRMSLLSKHLEGGCAGMSPGGGGEDGARSPLHHHDHLLHHHELVAQHHRQFGDYRAHEEMAY